MTHIHGTIDNYHFIQFCSALPILASFSTLFLLLFCALILTHNFVFDHCPTLQLFPATAGICLVELAIHSLPCTKPLAASEQLAGEHVRCLAGHFSCSWWWPNQSYKDVRNFK